MKQETELVSYLDEVVAVVEKRNVDDAVNDFKKLRDIINTACVSLYVANQKNILGAKELGEMIGGMHIDMTNLIEQLEGKFDDGVNAMPDNHSKASTGCK